MSFVIRFSTAFALAIAAGGAQLAHAGATHAAFVGINCTGPACVGEDLPCIGDALNADGFGDVIEVTEMFVIVNPGRHHERRIPKTGSLPIVAILGNTICENGNEFPCHVGPAGCTAFGLPGTLNPGFVRVSTMGISEIEPNDIGPDNRVRSQLFAVVRDLCNGEGDCGEFPDCCQGISDPGCDEQPTMMPSSPHNTVMLDCNDGIGCTADSCAGSQCINQLDDAFCNYTHPSLNAICDPDHPDADADGCVSLRDADAGSRQESLQIPNQLSEHRGLFFSWPGF